MSHPPSESQSDGQQQAQPQNPSDNNNTLGEGESEDVVSACRRRFVEGLELYDRCVRDARGRDRIRGKVNRLFLTAGNIFFFFFFFVRKTLPMLMMVRPLAGEAEAGSDEHGPTDDDSDHQPEDFRALSGTGIG